jgi:GT2 family glycosyltransferase
VRTDQADHRVSVIVLNMNGGGIILDCLRSLGSQDPRPDLTIVVDNGSDDGSDGAVEREFPDAVLLRQGRNTGFAGGNNTGLRHAVGDLVVLLNNDCIVEAGWLSSLLGTVTSDPGIGAVASSMRNVADISILDSAGGTMDWMGFARDRGSGRPASDFPEGDGVPFPCGGAMMVRRSALPFPGRIFDDGLFIYFEDLELGIQLNRLGRRVVYDPCAVVRHAHSATTSGMGTYFKEYQCNRNRLVVLRRQLRPEVFRRIRPVLIGWELVRMASAFAGGRITHVRALRHAVRDGLGMPVERQDFGRPAEDVFREFAVTREGMPFRWFQDASRRAMLS